MFKNTELSDNTVCTGPWVRDWGANGYEWKSVIGPITELEAKDDHHSLSGW